MNYETNCKLLEPQGFRLFLVPFGYTDPWFYQWVDVGKARVRFLFESLENLNSNLQKLGSELIFLSKVQ
ncbi:deoxyribodipyrimidine photo-lyase [Nostoc sphaeroides]|uniref:Deoxyribodipyrimidine photolyase n=1 Tax=Nostoc sphaeroides CCNUC1 TaxID=2653204 RepID=A0A5P8WCR4_9NOSO|nr:deoxyribodipyrimidine photo-lyase [Nostoc sphaeroides]MCC5633692.1 deoxyribodipyrimidine photo-lyase [Nostoc sphaeroides CHAB 2801]QFS50603.1 deoxyribodipyrimidine photolyase [Nostoc sphaeroides CCNUC1]